MESEFGVGTTFSCWLPVAAEELKETLGLPLEVAEEETAATSILLIDDEAFNHELMERYLTRTGWTLAYADNGPDGLRLAKKLRPKVICLDILMPSMDGWSVLASLKNDPELADIPVVIWSMTSDRQLGYTLGVSEYLMKPVERDQLIRVMEKYISKRDEHQILVIEDDETTTDIMTKLLEREGYSVIPAVNGRLALEQMSSGLPSLILLDLLMPEMDVFQFIDGLSQHKEWSGIPIIVMTAKSITMEERQILNGYVKNIMLKTSLDQPALIEEIRKFIGDPKGEERKIGNGH